MISNEIYHRILDISDYTTKKLVRESTARAYHQHLGEFNP